MKTKNILVISTKNFTKYFKRIENVGHESVLNIHYHEVTGRFFEQELPNLNQSEFNIEKVINNKADKLYVKWEEFDDSLMVGST